MNVSKKCFKCEVVKPLSDFYKHPKMKDGHLNKCKDCAKKDVFNHREENVEKIRAYDRKRGRTQKRINENSARMKEYRKNYPEKYRVKLKFGNMLRSLKYKRPKKCLLCEGARQIEGHHKDYSKPFDVVWLCSSCHSGVHYGHIDISGIKAIDVRE